MSQVKSSSPSDCIINDAVSVFAYCKTDVTAMVTADPNTGEIWLPTSNTTTAGGTTTCWYRTITKDIQDFRTKLRWLTFEELHKQYVANCLKSPDLLEFFNVLRGGAEFSAVAVFNPAPEFCIIDNLVEITEEAVISSTIGQQPPPDKTINVYEQMLEAANFDINTQLVLYREFLLACFPSNYMSLQSFAKLVQDLGWPKEDTTNLFRSADTYLRNCLSFRELLYFLAITEPGVTHGGAPAELRCRYIFRFFDYDKNGLLKQDEMKNLIHMIRRSRKQPLDIAKVNQDLVECYKSIGLPDTHALTVPEFLRAVGELKIRGTSAIYRTPVSILKYIKDLSTNNRGGTTKDQKIMGAPNNTVVKAQTTVPPVKQSVKTPPRQPTPVKDADYELAVHTIKIQKTSINVDQLWTLTQSVTLSSTRQPNLNEANRRLSIDHFNQHSQSNELLKEVRYLSHVNERLDAYVKHDKFKYNWGQLDTDSVAKHVIAVCNQVKEIFQKEPRLLEISSPVYVMGDLHGNFANLLYFERLFWQVGPGLCPCNLLFLGDYVDRGMYSFEVIAYLFCYKIQCPEKLKMVRGNHEIKRVQMQWTFEKECRHKFGVQLGLVVFNIINDAFNTMPLAAVIDGKVFCCHGGIPPPWLCPLVAAINEIPTVLNEPQLQSSLAWELMWNDPVRPKYVTDDVAMELLSNEGFAVNSRRGTAHVFNVEALEKFLHANGFTHIIRAHEVAEAGFYVQQKGRLVTVFSSAKYCGGDNEAACVLADHGKLRFMRLETE